MFERFLNAIFSQPPPKTGYKCEKCYKVLYDRRQIVRRRNHILCQQCADWSDEFLNEIQMTEGDFDCGGEI